MAGLASDGHGCVVAPPVGPPLPSSFSLGLSSGRPGRVGLPLLLPSLGPVCGRVSFGLGFGVCFGCSFAFGPCGTGFGSGFGSGGDRGPLGYRAFWFPTVPVKDQPANFSMVGQDLSLAYPVWVAPPNVLCSRRCSEPQASSDDECKRLHTTANVCVERPRASNGHAPLAQNVPRRQRRPPPNFSRSARTHS